VQAAKEHWGADVAVLEGVTHDVMLGSQAAGVAAVLAQWLEQLPGSQTPGAGAGAADPAGSGAQS
jgi:hypothetical protein